MTFLLLLPIVFLGLQGCIERDIEDDENEILLPDPALHGGCPDTHQDGFNNDQSPYLGGSKEVLVEVSIASDFHCPYCMRFAMELMTFFDNTDYEKYVRINYHHYPLSYHKYVLDIHKAAIATRNQNNEKFWILHDEIFTRESKGVRMTIDELVEFAEKELELDMVKFEKDRKSKDTEAFIEYEKSQAQSLGLDGTPSAWVCGIKIGWPDLSETVDHFLEGAID